MRRDWFESAVGAWVLLIIASVWCSYANAGTTITNIVGKYEARNAAGVMLQAVDTLEQCQALLPKPTIPGKQRLGTCKLVYHIDGELNCDDAVKPTLETFIVLDGAVVVYAGPYCAPGETCTTPPDWDNRTFTYTDAGGIRFNADDTVDEYRLINAGPPACWSWQWVRQADPPVSQWETPEAKETWLTSAWVPPLDPDALGSADLLSVEGEQQAQRHEANAQ